MSSSCVAAQIASASVAASDSSRAQAREERPLEREHERRRLGGREALLRALAREPVEEAPHRIVGRAVGRDAARHQRAAQQREELLALAARVARARRPAAAGRLCRHPLGQHVVVVLREHARERRVGGRAGSVGHGRTWNERQRRIVADRDGRPRGQTDSTRRARRAIARVPADARSRGHAVAARAAPSPAARPVAHAHRKL